jgi:uncharacterized protein YndB with AHSA1/START domain
MKITPEFTVTRVFNAPRNLVFKAWTESEHLRHWWGPKGFTMLACKIALHPGGVFHYGMRAPTGQEMWGKWIFREILAPERLVFSAYFSDAEAGITANPFTPVWPPEVLSTILFSETAGQTTLTLHGIPINATAAEQKSFTDAFANMQQGWSGTLDQLNEFLEQP